MTGLQTAYYIIAIVFMGIMFIIFIMLLVAVMKIKGVINKVSRAQENLAFKMDQAKNVGDKAGAVLGTIRYLLR